MRRAARLVEKGKANEAMILFKKAIEKDPRDVMAHRGYQQLMFNQLRHKELVGEYRKRVEDNPSDGLAYYLYAVSMPSPMKARAIVARGLKADPDSIWLKGADRMFKADLEMDVGRTAKAREILGDPGSPGMLLGDYYAFRAYSFTLEGDSRKGISDLRRAMREFPLEYAYPMSMGYLLGETAQFELALSWYKKSQKLRDSAETKLGIASATNGLGQSDESSQLYEAVLKAGDPYFLGDYFALAGVNLYLGNLEEARKMISQVLKLDDGASAKSLLLEREKYTGTKKDVRKALNSILESHSQNQNMRYAIGRAQMFLGDYESAVETYTKIIEINPKSYEALMARGCGHDLLEHQRQAIEDLESSLRLSPHNLNALVCLSDAHIRLRRVEDSIRILSGALKKWPRNYIITYRLASAYKHAKKFDLAAKYYAIASSVAPAKEKKRLFAKLKAAKAAAAKDGKPSPRQVTSVESDFNLDASAKEALAQAKRIAEELGHPVVGIEHLLMALVAEDHGPAPAAMVLHPLGYDPQTLRTHLLMRYPKVDGTRPGSAGDFSERIDAVLQRAKEEGRDCGFKETTSELLFLGVVLTQDDSNRKFLGLQGINPKSVARVVKRSVVTWFFHEQTYFIPIAFHILKSEKLPEVNSDIEPYKLSKFLDRANRIWRPAGIQMYVASIDERPAREEEEFRRTNAKERGGTKVYSMLFSPPIKSPTGLDVYIIKKMWNMGIQFEVGNALLLREASGLKARLFPEKSSRRSGRTLAHEIGHFLSLDHVEFPAMLMSIRKSRGISLNDAVVLRARLKAAERKYVVLAPDLLKQAERDIAAGRRSAALPKVAAIVDMEGDSPVKKRAMALMNGALKKYAPRANYWIGRNSVEAAP